MQHLPDRARPLLLLLATLGACAGPRPRPLPQQGPTVFPLGLQEALLPPARRLAEDAAARQAAYAAVGLLVVVAFVALMRQRGDVAVTIEYPDELRGIFQVRMRSGRRAVPEPISEDAIRNGGTSSRRRHHMVSRETHFQRLFTGRYHLVLDGLLLLRQTLGPEAAERAAAAAGITST